jgi:type IV pilus assembly protein PilP
MATFMTRDRRARRLVLAALAALLCACDDGPATTNERGSDTAAAAKRGGAAAAGSNKRLDALVFKDEDFVESLRNRDPFRSYSTAFRAKGPEDSQRPVIMPTTAIEEMRLIAIVTGLPRPKAMLVDPANVGHVVERGDYIGRPKVIQASGSVSMTLNWRVDRIRENEVVLTQQDPTDPTRSALTKIMPLREEVAQKF